MRRLGLGVALLVAAALAMSVPVSAGTAESRQIATATANDFRAVITATKAAATGGEPPAATATVEGFVRSGDSWTSVGKQPLDSQPWFWFVLIDLGAVCELAVSDTPRESVAITLLSSQSTECAAPARFHVENGKLVEG